MVNVNISFLMKNGKIVVKHGVLNNLYEIISVY